MNARDLEILASNWPPQGLDACRHLGRTLLRTAVGPDADRLHRGGAGREASLAAVARWLRDRGVRVTRSELARVVHAHLTLNAFESSEAACTLAHVRRSHVFALQPLVIEERVGLLLRAERERLSVRAIRAEVKRRTACCASESRSTADGAVTEGVSEAAVPDLTHVEEKLADHERWLKRLLERDDLESTLDRSAADEMVGASVRLRGLLERLQRRAAGRGRGAG